MSFFVMLVLCCACFFVSSVYAINNNESGVFVSLSSLDYKKAIDVLSQTSQHNQLITVAIQQHVLPLLGKNPSLLDVGSGPGIVTRNLQPFFNSVTAIEPNLEMRSFYSKLEIDLHSYEFALFDTQEQFDFVLCSHVLYHMPEERMKQFIKKLLKHTSKGGFCFIALMADRGENHSLHSQFNKNYTNSFLVKKILNELSIPYTVISATNRFQASQREDMLALCRFFVYEDCLSREVLDHLSESESNEVESKISSICDSLLMENGTYQLNQEEDYCLIQIPS